MAASKTPKISIATLEQHIAKVSADLEKARTQQRVDAEKALAAAQKSAQAADKKFADLNAKGATTAAATARLQLLKKDAAEQAKALAAAKAVVDQINSAQKAATKFAREVAKLVKVKSVKVKTAKPAKGKKTNVEKEGSSVAVKAEKPAAKKFAQTKPAATPKVATEPVIVEQEKTAAPVAKPTVKKAAVKKAPIKKAPLEVAEKKDAAKVEESAATTPVPENVVETPAVAEHETVTSHVDENTVLPLQDENNKGD